MRAIVRGVRPSSRSCWLAVVLVAAACGGGGGGGTPTPSGPTQRAVTMPPPTAGDPAAPWLAAAPSVLTADPGPDRSVDSGAHVALDGSRSSAPVGAITAWSWVQVAGTTVTVVGADTAHPEFDAPAVSGGGVQQLAFELTVHDGTGASTTAAQLVVVHEPGAGGSTSSVDLVRAAVQRGALDRDAAAQYLAFAAFGDPRLPVQYRGTEVEASGSWVIAHLAKEYPTLSPAVQSVVQPFLLPPGHPTRLASLPRLLVSRSPTAVGAVAPAPEQRGIEGAHVVVWYWSDLPNGATTASNLLDEIEGVIWPKLTEVWRADHLPLIADGAVGAAFRGVHAKLNVFIDSIARDPYLGSAYGYFVPYGSWLNANPGFVAIRDNLAFSQANPPGMIEVAAHEITHACEASYDHIEDYAGHRFLYEAVAVWGSDDVYPASNAEHLYAPSLMDHPGLPLDDDGGIHPYGAYLFFQWYTRGLGDRDFVRRTFENFQHDKPIDAVEHAFPSYGGHQFGFQYNWGSFLEALWNRDPTKYFWGSDAMDRAARFAEPALTLTLGGGQDTDLVLDADVAYLSGKYHHIVVDPSVRTIHFYDGLTFNLEHTVADDGTTVITATGPMTEEDILSAVTRMLVKRGGQWKSITPTQVSAGNIAFCQDDPADAVEELVVIFGDAKPKRGHSLKPKGVPPVLWATNIGCFQWKGSVTATTSPSRSGIDPTETISATNLIFTPWTPLGLGRFQTLSGNVTWTMGGSVDNCTYSGHDTFAVGPVASYGPAGVLTFAPEILLGGIYRTYEASGSSASHEVTYTATCTGDGGTTVTTHTKTIDWLAAQRQADLDWRPSVSADGAVAADSADDGSMVYTWSFQREVGLPPL